MTDKEFNRQVKRIRRIFDPILVAFGLAGQWDLCVSYERGEGDQEEDNWSHLASCDSRWEYRQAQIRVYVEGMAKCTDAEIQKHLIHEIVHILVREMREWMHAEEGHAQSVKAAVQHEERVVSDITQVLTRALLMTQLGHWRVLVEA